MCLSENSLRDGLLSCLPKKTKKFKLKKKETSPNGGSKILVMFNHQYFDESYPPHIFVCFFWELVVRIAQSFLDRYSGSCDHSSNGFQLPQQFYSPLKTTLYFSLRACNTKTDVVTPILSMNCIEDIDISPSQKFE